MAVTIEQIRKAEKTLSQQQDRIDAIKEELKQAKADAEKTLMSLRRAIRGDEPELELQFINKKTGEVEK